jgi:O-antigen ligase
MFERIIYIANMIIAWGLPFSHVWCYLGGAVVFIVVFSQWSKAGKLKREPLFYWLLVFLMYMVLRDLFSAQPQEGYGIVFGFFAHWICPFIAGLLVVGALKAKKAFTTYYWVLFGIVFVSVLAYFGLFWQHFGTFLLVQEQLLKGLRHHIALAAVCSNLALISFSFAAFDDTATTKRRIIYIASGIFLCLAVVLTGSRGYYIALAGGLSIFTVYYVLRSRRFVLGGIITLSALVFFSAIFAFNPLVHGRVVSAVQQLTHLQAPTGGLITDGNVHERLALYTIALMQIKERPFFGLGPGQASNKKEYFDRVGKKDFLNDEGKPRHGHLHSLYLTIAAETGLVGLGLFLFLLFNVVRALYVKHKSTKGFISALALGVCFGLVTVAIGDMFDTHLRGPGVAMDLLWLSGLVLGFSNE